MTRRISGRHRAPRQLPRTLTGTATVAASGLLVAAMGTTTASAAPAQASPLKAQSGVANQPTPAPVFDLTAEIQERTEAVVADKPVTPAKAKADAEVESSFGAIGFDGVEPAPEPEPVVEATVEASTETRTQQGASRSQTREQAPAQTQQAPAQTEQAPAAAPAVSAGAEGAVQWALAHTGLPYAVGSSSGGGYDCSGFTTAAFRAAGISLPHGSQAQYHATARVSLDNIQRGDLLFYSSNGSASGIFHVAIYLGNGQVVHSLRDWSGGFSGSKVTGMHYSPGLMGAGRP